MRTELGYRTECGESMLHQLCCPARCRQLRGRAYLRLAIVLALQIRQRALLTPRRAKIHMAKSTSASTETSWTAASAARLLLLACGCCCCFPSALGSSTSLRVWSWPMQPDNASFVLFQLSVVLRGRIHISFPSVSSLFRWLCSPEASVTASDTTKIRQRRRKALQVPCLLLGGLLPASSPHL